MNPEIIWPITLFFLALAVLASISSVYWNHKYHDLNDMVQRAINKSIPKSI